MTQVQATQQQSDSIPQNIWLDTLKSATRSTGIQKGTVLFLKNSGKSTLLRTFPDRVAINHDKYAYVLDYSFVNITLPNSVENESIAQLDIWQLDDLAQAGIINKIMMPNFDVLNSLIYVIEIDFSDPSNILNNFQQCIDTLTNVHQNLTNQLSKQETKKLKEKVSKSVQFFVNQISKDDTGATKNIDNLADNIDEETKKIVLDSSNPKINLGIPIIVVGSHIESFAKGLGVNQDVADRFETISKILREKCLDYGAAIIYVSNNFNQDILKDYIYHRIFGFDLKHRAKLFTSAAASDTEDELDLIFIPSGFDSLHMIDGASSTSRSKSKFTRSTPIETLLPKNLSKQKKPAETEVKATDDQVFLKTLQFITDNQREPDKQPKMPAPKQNEASEENTKLNAPSITVQPPVQRTKSSQVKAVPGQPQPHMNNQVRGFFESLLTRGSKDGKDPKKDASKAKTRTKSKGGLPQVPEED